MRALLRMGVWVAAAGSLACTIYTGRHNSSVLLIALFAVWVLSPFAGLWWMDRFAETTPQDMASAIRASALVICLSSLVLYVAMAASGPGHQATFAFLVTPASSWLAILTMRVATRFARKR